MITIDRYSAHWNSNLNPTCPPEGTEVRLSTTCDAREIDEFQHLLYQNGKGLTFVRAEDEVFDIYRIESP